MIANWVMEAAGNAAAGSAAPQLPDLGLIANILQLGFVGVVIVCLISRKYIVPEWTLKETEDRHDQAMQDLTARYAETRAQLDRLQDVFQGQMIPALTRATEINARYNEELQRRRYQRGNQPDPSAEPDSE